MSYSMVSLQKREHLPLSQTLFYFLFPINMKKVHYTHKHWQNCKMKFIKNLLISTNT